MRQLLLCVTVFLTGTVAHEKANAQGVWTQKANVGGSTILTAAVGFSIGTKGYIGTGYSYNQRICWFWEWDQGSNVWTQKASFGGTARDMAVGFSIGAKGYIGTGWSDSTYYNKDFWEWDQATNTWTKKADFGGTGRMNAVGFSIGTKGYIGTGEQSAMPYRKNDFWEYDPTNDTWTQKANFGGTPRIDAVGFSIGTKGYIGTGIDTAVGYTKDFWEWDQATNIWTKKADFAGVARELAVGFSIGTKGYIGTGSTGSSPYTFYKDFYEWDQTTNLWTQKANFGGIARSYAVGFSIGTKGYTGTGYYGSTAGIQDFWEFDPTLISVNEIEKTNIISIYPNPFSYSTTLQTDKFLKNVSLTIYNSVGLTVKRIDNLAGQTVTFNRDNLPSGLYFVRLTQDGNTISADKFVITDK